MVARAPWGAAGEFAASRHGVITRSQAAEMGISSKVVRRLLRDGELDERAPGVLVVVGSPTTWRQRLYIEVMSNGAAGRAASRSAAALHLLDGYGEGPLEVLMPGKRRKANSIAVHRYGPMGAGHAADFVTIDAIPCTGVARTLCDIASVDPVSKVQLAFESARRRGCSLEWVRQTAERLHRPGQRGTGVILDLIERAGTAATESALEVRVEQALDGVPGLVRQYSVFDSRGRFLARTDFAIPELKLAIEAHSREFHFSAQQRDHDAAREAALQEDGWVVRYVTHAQARNARELRRSLLRMIASRKRELWPWTPS